MAFTGLVQAVGGDVDKVSVLVDELREKPELIQEIEERQIVRRRIATNKSIGELVETLLRAALKGAGLEVTRTGVGSDYEVTNDIVDGDAETWFAIGNTTNRVLVEVKATTVDSVRMTLKYRQSRQRWNGGSRHLQHAELRCCHGGSHVGDAGKRAGEVEGTGDTDGVA